MLVNFVILIDKHDIRIGAVKFTRMFKDGIASIFNKTVADGFVDPAMSDYVNTLKTVIKYPRKVN